MALPVSQKLLPIILSEIVEQIWRFPDMIYSLKNFLVFKKEQKSFKKLFLENAINPFPIGGNMKLQYTYTVNQQVM